MVKYLSVFTLLFCVVFIVKANNHAHNQNLDFQQLELLAVANDISTQYDLGVMYAEGIGVEKSLSKAKHYLDKVINNTNKSALILADVAKIYWEIFELWKY